MPSTAGGFCPHCQKSYFPQTPEQTLIRALTHLRASSTHHCNEPVNKIKINTWIEFPEIVEVSVEACVVATEDVELPIVADCGQ